MPLLSCHPLLSHLLLSDIASSYAIVQTTYYLATSIILRASYCHYQVTVSSQFLFGFGGRPLWAVAQLKTQTTKSSSHEIGYVQRVTWGHGFNHVLHHVIYKGVSGHMISHVTKCWCLSLKRQVWVLTPYVHQVRHLGRGCLRVKSALLNSVQ